MLSAPATGRRGKTIDHRPFFTIGTRAEIVVDPQPGSVGIHHQCFGQTIRLGITSIRRQGLVGKRPAQLDFCSDRIAPANLERIAFQGKQLAVEQREVGKVLGHGLGMGELHRLHFLPGLAQQHTRPLTIPHTLPALDRDQATSLTLGGQPDLIALRVDRQAFEQGIEMQQHAAGPCFAHHARGDFQPLRRTAHRHLQHRRMGFADNVAVTGGIAGDAFKVQVTTANERSSLGARAQPPR
ncbi:hypothetical protein AZH11_10980 [Pseudomonas simiae]|nr:hypothetical protein AZH11_10980 [Pseudomonas simiae]